MTFNKPQAFPILFIIAATLLLGWLGAWQLERMKWKEGIIAQIEKGQSAPPLTQLAADENEMMYHKLSLSGEFLHDKRMYVTTQPRGGRPGFSLLTPFKLSGSQGIVLVNRGWTPRGLEALPAGKQQIEGVVRPMRPKNPTFSGILPKSQPNNNIWFYEDQKEMSEFAGNPLPSYIIEQTGAAKADIFPTPSNGRISVRNDHLGYAITWFTLAFAGIIMFAIYHRKK